MSSIIDLISSIFSAITPFFKRSEFKEKYEDIRFEIAEALTMYADCYSNPVDLKDMPENKLPEKYIIASTQLRKLGAQVDALAGTMSMKKRKRPISHSDLKTVSADLIRLSNSMTVPFGCGALTEDYLNIDNCVDEIKRILKL